MTFICFEADDVSMKKTLNPQPSGTLPSENYLGALKRPMTFNKEVYP